MKYKRPAFIILIGTLFLLSAVLIIFDAHLSSAALDYKNIATNETVPLGEFFQIVRLFGKTDVMILLGLVLAFAGRRRLGGKILISLLMVGILVYPVKILVGRQRPTRESYVSFPSGDTATAFTMPVILSGNAPLALLTGAVACGTGASRVFFGDHYPADVFAGAAFGLVAAVLALAITRRIKWLPSQQIVAYALFIFMLFTVLNAFFDGHHRHMVQFVAWFGPVLALYASRSRLIYRYARKWIASPKSPVDGSLHFLLKETFHWFTLFGILLLVGPWFVESAAGVRIPCFSAGIFIIIFSRWVSKDMRNRRYSLVASTTAVALLIVQVYGAAYILGIL